MKLLSKLLWVSLLASSCICTSAIASQNTTEKHINIVAKVSPKKVNKAPKESALDAYLFVYFKDETHSVYFATSKDGYIFTDVNNGEPALLGGDIAEQKGVRDPHIFRGADNAFYMSMTDLHIFAKDKGLRKTEWERSREGYGWGNNKNLILMKSYNLVDWTLARINVAEAFPSAGDLGAVWAPQTIFDQEKNQLMVYYTTRVKNGHDHLVYSYANSDFTALTAEPKKLFDYPNKEVSFIDGDIIKVGGKYHLTYVTHEKPGNIRIATSDKINTGYVYNPKKIDPENVAAEAPNVWRRGSTDTYVLMYDVFGAKPKNNMGFAETTDFINFKNLGRFNESDSKMKAVNFSNPKHGSIISITTDELNALNGYFK